MKNIDNRNGYNIEMDIEIPVLSGYLNVPTQSGFPLNRISKKKSSQKFCLLFKSSRHGIERLEICESKDDKNPKIITLENCVKITQEPPPVNLIHIVKKTGTLTLNALNEEDLKEWISELQKVAFRDKTHLTSTIAAIEEDNDLYCSSFGDGHFIVTLIPSDASKRCNIDPKVYVLHLSTTELQLKSAEDVNNTIANWPYRFIRKYGYRDGKFTFEAGRKCSTGEGVFTLDHTNPQEVFRCMSSKMKSMKKLITSDSINSIECGENQLNVAASMEPGSRSPLPPSPSNLHSSEFEINSTQSALSIRGFKSSSDSLNNNSTSALPSSKIIPNKPPRKIIISAEKICLSTPAHVHTAQHNCDKIKKYKSYDPVSITTSIDPNKAVGSSVIIKPSSPKMYNKACIINSMAPELPVRRDVIISKERDYESIEAITDAWKTLGIDEVKHTERLSDNTNDDDLNVMWQRLQSQREKNCQMKESLGIAKTTKVIDIDIGETVGNGIMSGLSTIDPTYDRLDFLLANNKESSGYKTIVTVSSTSSRSRCMSPPQNDYEFINIHDKQSLNKTDDNYLLGYGGLRNTSSAGFSSKMPSSTSQSNIITNLSTNTTLNDINSNVKVSLEENALDHHNCNGLNYTIVSKPKRV